MTRRLKAIGFWVAAAWVQSAVAQGVDPAEAEPSEQAEAAEGAAEGEGAVVSAEAPAEAEASAAGAEAEAPEAGERRSSDSDDIVVTGSRIRQTSFSATAPVEVVGRKQLEQSGIANLAQMVQFLTSSAGNAAGTPYVNLRGLGTGATLVLINGRRLNVTAGPVGAADITTIPVAAVERVEILKGGAAAIYGADAVAGVINIITRRTFDGVRAQIDARTTEHADPGGYQVSASFGSMSEHSRVMLAGTYARATQLLADQRPFTANKFTSTQGYPGGFSPVHPATMGMPGLTGLVPDPDCGRVPGTTIIPLPPQGSTCSDSYRPYITLFGPSESFNAFGSGEYDLTDHLTLFSELTFSRFRGSSVSSIVGVLPPYPVVPANHVDNPFHQEVQWIGRPRGGRETAEPLMNTAAEDDVRGVVGLKGELKGIAAGTMFESWTYELYSSLGVSRYRRTFNDNLRAPLQAALNSCSDPADLSHCFNPFYSASTGEGTANSLDVIRTFDAREGDITDETLATYNAGMSGSLFQLPGGDVGVAFGGEVRRETRSGEVDHDYSQGNYGFYGGSGDARAKRYVYSGYLELRWPLLRGLDLQTAARIEHYSDFVEVPISPSAGLTFAPADMIGIDSTPGAFRRLSFRGNVAKAFKAPTIYQSYPGQFTAPTPLVRQGRTVADWIPVTTSGNPALGPETAYTITGGLNWLPIEQISLALEAWYYNYKNRIQPEVSSQILAQWEANGGAMGLFMDPRVVYTAATDTVGPIYVTTINVAGPVITRGLDFGVTFHIGNPQRSALGSLSLGAEGTYTDSYTIPRRETTLRTFATPTGMFGRLGPLDCNGSAAVDLDLDPKNNTQNDLDRCDVVGKRNYNNIAPPLPRLKANIPLTWALGGHAASLITHYISSYLDDVQPLSDGSLKVIPAMVTFDVQYGYTMRNVIGKTFAFNIGVANLLNWYPPVVNGATTAYDGETHDPRGRMFFAKVAAEL